MRGGENGRGATEWRAVGQNTVTRGVVLSGGGVAGVAWELGLIAGLRARGVDLREADLIVGTSAGSVVGSILRAGDVDASYASVFEPVDDAPPPGDPLRAERLMAAFAEAAAGGGGEQAVRARIGALARTAEGTGSEEQNIARIARLLPPGGWPDRLRVTAVDAVDGSFVLFDAASGVPFERAVAASCAVPVVFPAITIDGRTYTDGGVRSVTNADAAADVDRLLVIACSVEPASSPAGPTLPEVIRSLKGSTEVMVIQADEESTRAFGADTPSVSTRLASAEAGRRQADDVAEAVRAFWG